jgi:hypothetical protein
LCGCGILYEAEYYVKKIKVSTPRKPREDKQKKHEKSKPGNFIK